MKYAGLDCSVGKQSLWWGPGEGGALLMSNNATPLWMMQINSTSPIYIPGVSKVLGPIEADNFFGSLAQHHFPPGPYMFGQKFSCKPLRDLELSISRTAVFAGEGHVPLTFGSFWNSFTSFSNVPNEVKFSRNDPGARHAQFDLVWRLPYLQTLADVLQQFHRARRYQRACPTLAPESIPAFTCRTSRNSRSSISGSRLCTPIRPIGPARRTISLLGNRLSRSLPE